jgi:hypothetical protein
MYTLGWDGAMGGSIGSAAVAAYRRTPIVRIGLR